MPFGRIYKSTRDEADSADRVNELNSIQFLPCNGFSCHPITIVTDFAHVSIGSLITSVLLHTRNVFKADKLDNGAICCEANFSFQSVIFQTLCFFLFFLLFFFFLSNFTSSLNYSLNFTDCDFNDSGKRVFLLDVFTLPSFIDATEHHSREEELADLFADEVERDIRLSRGPNT